ncbi:hypothetical protein L210DRAFT_3557029 [Boletus edulis BED1]|uniref:Uncharacterized protein n=1 Tax=Boletus edulis BED1 TaxID=1328754 RepID=A0AAD4BKN6_BOLED|nr:hypothetical protein L210DRAFT_3557029 [Boletus edulis BED1]
MGVIHETPELAVLPSVSTHHPTHSNGAYTAESPPPNLPVQTRKRCCGHKSLYHPSASLLCSEVRFANFPRTLSVGGAETLVDQIRILGKRMATDMGDGLALPE